VAPAAELEEAHLEPAAAAEFILAVTAHHLPGATLSGRHQWPAFKVREAGKKPAGYRIARLNLF